MKRVHQSIFKRVISTLLIFFNLLILFPFNSLATNEDTLKVGGVYSGFKLISQKNINEIDSNTMVFNHEKTGARLIFLKNNDTNKTFSINFRTPPKDNTGVNHIIEHSVLNGSKKYPVKDPFLQMNKQSLKTFLNAFTASDYTSYPVSSKNEKDFFNLMSVYLDAVFYPNIYDNPYILMQEGWRHELTSKDAPLKYNGIVYSEMKGALSSPESALHSTINASLFPNSIYKWNSGGDPDSIPNLTKEQFLNTHKEYYSPSNSYIYLYGNLDILKSLKFIDEEYLNNFDKTNINTSIKPQKSFTKKQIVVDKYPISKGSSTKNKTFLSLNYVIDTVKNKEDILGFAILDKLLFGTDNSPLKKALIENQLGNTAYSQLDVQKLQPTYSIVVSNSEESKKDKFEKVIKKTLKEIVKNGFDKESLDAAFNSYEISTRLENSGASRGIGYSGSVMLGWLYDQDPTLYLEHNKDINNIKKKIEKKYFENLIEKYLLNNKHSSLVILKPSPGLEESKNTELKKKLEDYKKSLSPKEIENLVTQTNEFKKWQETPDSEEALNSLPSLSISDISKSIEKLPTVEREIDNIKILDHSLFTNNITFTNMYFDSSRIPQDKLLYLHLLSDMLGKVSTEKYDEKTLSKLVSSNTGSIRFNPKTFSKYKGNGEYYPKLAVSLNSLDENLLKSFELVEEIINKSKFDNKQNIKKLINEKISELESVVNNYTHSIALSRAISYISEEGKYNDLSIIEYYNFLRDLNKNYDSKFNDIQKNLNEVSNIIFNKNNLIVSYTGDKENYSKFEKSFKSISSKIKDGKFEPQKYEFDYSTKNEGLTLSSKVQNIAKVYDFTKLGYDYSGKMKVLNNILNNDYLWQEVRVKGGAYGGMFDIAPTGRLVFLSYRDPNLKETLNVFDKAPDYLRNFKANDKDMTNHIIGTIGNIDAPLDPNQKGSIADMYYISNITDEDLQKERDEILNTKSEDIVSYTDMIEKAMKENYYCVVGSESKINENKDLFNSVKSAVNNE